VGTTGGTANVYRYQGEAFDAETGLYYLRARYYDPVAGRFLSVDPMADQGQHPYTYAGADPVNGHDPTGTQDVIEYSELLVIAAAVPVAVIGVQCLLVWELTGEGAMLSSQAGPFQGCSQPERKKTCRACSPPVGTQMYRVDFNQKRPHYDKPTGITIPAGVAHWHLYEVTQRPLSAGCLCDVHNLGQSGLYPPAPLGAIPICPVSGGGIE